MPARSSIKFVRNWLCYLGKTAPQIAKLCLAIVYPFPRLYGFVAKSAKLTRLAERRVWHIRSGPLRGFQLTQLLPDEIWPVLNNSMEIRCSNVITRLPLKNGIVLDIGASYGYYTLLLSRLVGEAGRVYCFEPDWHSFERLTHNLALNDRKNVLAVPICISNLSVGMVKWQSSDDQPWSSRIADPSLDNSFPYLTAVPVTTLDEFVNILGITKQIQLIKIDVEGAELEVLQGAVALLGNSHPPILCELHGADIAQRVFEFLERLEYQWEKIEYMNETRQHILAFAPEQAAHLRSLILSE
jgi:FkbM family methyltransferase